MLLPFLTLIGLLSYGLHAYVFWRLPMMLDGEGTGWLSSALNDGALIGLSCLTLSYFIVTMSDPRRWRPLGWLSGAWMGLIALLCLWTGLHHGFSMLGALAGLQLPTWAGPAGISAAVLSWGRGLYNATRPPTLVRHELPLKSLPPELDGMRVVQLSDIHVGPTIGRAFMERLVARVNALSPDLIVITGDLVDGGVSKLAYDVAPIFDLKAPQGVYFITGNHELISGVDPWVAHLRGGGIHVLENASVTLNHRGVTMHLAGVEDWESARFHPSRSPNLNEALAGCDPTRFTILLAHQPKAIKEASLRAVDLQLSGHTHGGQIAPFTWLVYLDQPYRSGLYTVNQTTLYVSEGTGYWGPPVRLGTRAELTLLTLRHRSE